MQDAYNAQARSTMFTFITRVPWFDLWNQIQEKAQWLHQTKQAVYAILKYAYSAAYTNVKP